ncbi:membrane-associated protein, putative [Bodo saltans]|uniref:Membrane-associated protein, putative n=1 Tax=Bodo saltans TaxID=75058 RepID=A0A0S4J941_BODSA|nr:membrane-associated protein, putative [Bodo saltans]|eukprot:CUG85234.1 membrane-associated protein, putative [Bodo saltans]
MHCLLIPFKLLSPKSILRSLLTTLIVTSLAVFGVSGLSFTFVFDDSTDVIDINFPPNQTSGVVNYSFIENPRVPVVPSLSGGANGCSNDILHDSYFSNLSVPYLSLTTAFATRARHPCRYIAPAPYFQAATEGWNHSFSFKNTRVTSITDPTQVLQCGMSCSVTSAQFDGSIVTTELDLGGTVGLIQEVTLNTTYVFNVSTETYMNRSSSVLDHFTRVRCDVVSRSSSNNSSNAGFNDAVCTGYIQYNSSFWENGTLFALPQNFSAPVVTNDVVLSGYPSTLTFYVPGLTTCPRYLVERPNPGWGRNTPRTEPDSPYNSFVTLLLEEPTQFFNLSTVDIALINVTCTPPLSGSGDVIFVGRLGNSATDSYVRRIYTSGPRSTGDFLQPASITILKITPFFWGPAVTPVIAAGVRIRQLPVMQANLSSWSPSANYSTPPNSQNPSRCYKQPHVQQTVLQRHLGSLKFSAA